MKTKVLRYLLARFKEPSSIAAYILAICTALGRNISPEVIGAWVAVSGGLVGFLLYLYPELNDDQPK